MSAVNNEESSSGFSPKLLERVIPESKREISGVKLRKVDKTGSSLHLINVGDEEILRNANVIDSSAASWEFLHSFAQDIFPEEIKEKLFGIWGKPQVASILSDENGGSRIYHREGFASVYSESMGFDTMTLARDLNVADVFPQYATKKEGLLTDDRWLASAAYFFTKDIVTETDWMDPNNELMSLIENFWQEMFVLNKDKDELNSDIFTRDVPYLENKRSDIFKSSNNIKVSLRLIELGHDICEELRSKYRDLEGKDSNWREKSSVEVVLFLLHIYQTTVQEIIQWWLGITQGHLHAGNTVSIPVKDHNSIDFPLRTTIIDFDDSWVNAGKLAENDELYQNIESNKLKDLIADESKHISLRLTLILYLPLKEWNPQIAKLVIKNSNNFITEEIYKLISLRLAKDVDNSILFTNFANLLYLKEKNSAVNEGLFAFSQTAKVVGERPDLIDLKNKDLSILAAVFIGNISSIQVSSLSQLQERLLISGIFFKNLDSWAISSLTKNDLELLLSLFEVGSDDSIKSLALNLLHQLFVSYNDTLIPQLITEVRNDKFSPLLDKIFKLSLTQFHLGNETLLKELTFKFIRINNFYFFLNFIDLFSLGSRDIETLYAVIGESLSKHWVGDEKEKKKEMEKAFDSKFRRSLGGFFIMKQKVKKLFNQSAA